MLEKLSNLPLPRVQYGEIDGVHSTAERRQTSTLRAPSVSAQAGQIPAIMVYLGMEGPCFSQCGKHSKNKTNGTVKRIGMNFAFTIFPAFYIDNDICLPTSHQHEMLATIHTINKPRTRAHLLWPRTQNWAQQGMCLCEPEPRKSCCSAVNSCTYDAKQPHEGEAGGGVVGAVVELGHLVVLPRVVSLREERRPLWVQSADRLRGGRG